MLRKIFIVAICIVVALATGCGNLFPVTGRVVLDGEAVAGATVSFSPDAPDDKTGNAVGMTDPQGVYTLRQTSGDGKPGVRCGEYKVTVSKQMDNWDGKSYTKTWLLMKKAKKTTSVQLMPNDYTSPDTTPLSYKVVKGKNRFDIEIHSKSEPK